MQKQQKQQKNIKREKMHAMAGAELKRLRLEMRFAPRDMCEVLGLKRRTYQDYEAGKRGIPAVLAVRIREMHKRDREFIAGIGDRIDAAERGDK